MTDEVMIQVGQEIRPATAEEIEEIQNDPGRGPERLLALDRDTKIAEIKAALIATDVWAIRAAEDGVPLEDARKGYREQLRALLAEARASDDPAAIEIPTAPEWVPPAS
jgi:hypothetical protein